MTRIAVFSACYLTTILYLSGCSTIQYQDEPAAAPPLPAEEPAPDIKNEGVSQGAIPHEGGIVGTGNNPDCPSKDNKGNCVENKP